MLPKVGHETRDRTFHNTYFPGTKVKVDFIDVNKPKQNKTKNTELGRIRKFVYKVRLYTD